MKENTKNILLGVLIVGLVAMTVAYAALTTNLSISGTATVARAEWNVKLDSFANDTSVTSAGVTSISTGTASDNTNTTKIENFTATLNQPGDKVRFTFNIINAGTINAKKVTGNNGFSKTISVARKTGTDTYDTAQTSTTYDYNASTVDGVKYTVSCSNDATLAANNGTATCYLEIEYVSDMTGVTGNQSSTTPGEDQTATIAERKVEVSANWSYEQAS